MERQEIMADVYGEEIAVEREKRQAENNYLNRMQKYQEYGRWLASGKKGALTYDGQR